MYHCPNLVFHPWNSFFLSICRCCCPLSYLFHRLIRFQNFSLVVFPFGFSLTCFWISPLNCLLFILFCYLFLGRVLSWFPCLLESSMRSFLLLLKYKTLKSFHFSLCFAFRYEGVLSYCNDQLLLVGWWMYVFLLLWKMGPLFFIFSFPLLLGVLLLMWVSRHYLHVGLCFWLVFREKGSWLQQQLLTPGPVLTCRRGHWILGLCIQKFRDCPLVYCQEACTS